MGNPNASRLCHIKPLLKLQDLGSCILCAVSAATNAASAYNSKGDIKASFL